MTAKPSQHVAVLDGLRAISILAVLVTHLLPVRAFGRAWNDSVGVFGMSMFFVLSGFLITQQLQQRISPQEFAWRRLLRVLPAAWLCALLVWFVFRLQPTSALWGHLFFYANWPPQQLIPPLDHYWSLCVELQFYVLAFGLLWMRPQITWWALPVLLLASTSVRVVHMQMASSFTWYRIDDLLAGACVALLLNSRYWPKVRACLGRRAVPSMLMLALFVACLLPSAQFNPLTFFRPYIVGALLAALLVSHGGNLARQLSRPSLAYIAAISFALYLWHLPLAASWLGEGDVMQKYLKRPLLLVVLFAVAHVSTYYFERPISAWGQRLSRRWRTQEVAK